MQGTISTKLDLKDQLSRDQFKVIQTSFVANYQLPLECTGLDGKEVVGLCSQPCHPYYCRLIRNSRIGAARCRQDRLRSMNIALETGQPYISLCHAGIVLVCVPIMDGETPLGGMFFGKCLWERPDELFEAELKKRLRGLRYDFFDLHKAAQELQVIAARKIHEAAEFLYVLLYQTAELDPCVVQWRRQKTQQQSRISEVIQESKRLGADEPYPYESERELIAKVKIGDRTGAREILNNLLGMILFHSPGDMNVLKARLVELLSVLSRAAAQGGVDINVLLNKNLDYINKVLSIHTQDDLWAWISRALEDFIESVYSCQDARKMSQLRPAMEYMEANYNRPITLADIAREAHLSVSRLAHLFREQMGITLIDYLTNVRINAAKRLMLKTEMNCTQVCFEVGYNNQSYFTRTFKQVTGMTPRQFRQANKRT